MAGYLYAVIFEQGTVKVGMSENSPDARIIFAMREAIKWRLKVHRSFSVKYETDDVGFRELSLCGFCQIASESVGGYEWFKFETPQIAEENLINFFSMIHRNEFGKPQSRRSQPKPDKDLKFSAAMTLIKEGIPARQAANMVDVHVSAITNRAEYMQLQMGKDLAHIETNLIRINYTV